MAVIDLTEARIRELEPGSGIWRDEQVKALLVICHANTKTYAVQGDVRRNGRHIGTVRVKIDRVDRVGLREARRRAKEIISQIQGGVDPTAKPEESGIIAEEVNRLSMARAPVRSPSGGMQARRAGDARVSPTRGKTQTDSWAGCTS